MIRGLRGWTKVPIIVLSVREAERDKVAALDAGADDYVTKPFGMDELLARLRAALRRAAPAEEEAVVETDDFTVDLAAKRVTTAAGEVRLTPTEWHIVEMLVRNAGKLVTQRQLLQEVWGPQYEKETNYLRVYLAQIRRKLEPDPARPPLLRHRGADGLPLRAGTSRNLTFAGHPVTMGGRMTVDIVGREEELGSLTAFLERRAPTHGPIAIALEGEAGIGKSTLWRAAVEAARGRGLRVLSSRPAESERALAYAGLGDLLDGVLDDVLPALTPPRRRALEVALLVEDAAGRPVDPRALGVAVRSALELLAEDELVVAIDDLQWLDASSASALGFALRRLPEANILLLWTRRLGEPGQSSAVEDALDDDRIERVRGRPAQRRRDASGSAQPARRRSAAADAAPAARGVGRESVLCARARAGARRRGRDSRSDAAAAGARAAGGAGLRAARRLRRRDAARRSCSRPRTRV